MWNTLAVVISIFIVKNLNFSTKILLIFSVMGYFSLVQSNIANRNSYMPYIECKMWWHNFISVTVVMTIFRGEKPSSAPHNVIISHIYCTETSKPKHVEFMRQFDQRRNTHQHITSNGRTTPKSTIDFWVPDIHSVQPGMKFSSGLNMTLSFS